MPKRLLESECTPEKWQSLLKHREHNRLWRLSLSIEKRRKYDKTSKVLWKQRDPIGYGEYRRKGGERYRRRYPDKNMRKYEEKYYSGLRQTALKRDNYTCVNCGMTNDKHKITYGKGITVDHIDGNGYYAVIKNNILSNLQTLCLRCHGSKDSKAYWETHKKCKEEL